MRGGQLAPGEIKIRVAINGLIKQFNGLGQFFVYLRVAKRL